MKTQSKFHKRMTNTEFDLIKQDFASGMLMTDLSKKYGWSTKTLQIKLKKVFKSTNNKKTPQTTVNKWVSLWKQGKNASAIARDFGTSQALVSKCLNSSGISGRQSFENRFFNKVFKTKTCWNWTGCKDPKGYGYILINKKNKKAHRVSYEMSNGVIPKGMLVMHSCDNPSCVNPAHLSIGTNTQNLADMVSKNRQCKGEGKWNAKLTEDNVREIISLFKQGYSLQKIADTFNVTHSTINYIHKGKTWTHITNYNGEKI